jgi:hypothetical protein
MATLTAASRHHVVRLVGAQLGSRADRLSPAARRLLSLERRETFVPAHLDAPANRTGIQDTTT